MHPEIFCRIRHSANKKILPMNLCNSGCTLGNNQQNARELANFWCAFGVLLV